MLNEDFADADHLNLQGSLKFTAFLMDTLLSQKEK
jgi:hypothetical protein